MHIANYLGLIHKGEVQLAEALMVVSERHMNDSGVREQCKLFAQWSRAHLDALQPFEKRYGRTDASAPEKLRGVLFDGTRTGEYGLLRDLQDLSTLASSVRTNYTILQEGALALRDSELETLCETLGGDTNRQIDWLCTAIKQAAAQALTVEGNKISEMKAALPKKPTVAAIPDMLWAPVVGGGLLLIVGLAGLSVGQPWLFPSLGPTAYLQAETPVLPRSKMYNIIVGHGIGIIMAFLALLLLNVYHDPALAVDKTLTLGRVIASVLAVAATMSAAYFLRASHPPAAATTLLITLGALQTPEDIFHLALGVLLLALVGEGVRRLRLGNMPLTSVFTEETAGR